jgi:anti-sigma regulatory factor (Ser/Thr protein kinase)
MIVMGRAAAGQAAATGYSGTFPGRPDQVQRARHEVARHLAGHPVTDDAVLVISELAGNAVLHSGSKGGFFTVRAELHGTCCYIECEDAGGPWHPQPPDAGRPHGLDLVEALSGPDSWGVDGDAAGRVVWARLEAAGP